MGYFNSASLTFLKGLKRHNEKSWFEAHREDWQLAIHQPMVGLVEEMDLRFARFAPEIAGDPRRSIFRIHRDIRFSKDKSPYKTHAACWFFHGAGSSKVGREAHGGGAGFYFHLEPGASQLGAGCWMPPQPALRRFREAIARDVKGFERVVLAPALGRRMGGLDADSMLKRVPRGYDEQQPGARWLRYNSFTMGRGLTDAQVTSARLTTTLESDFKLLLPLVRWLNGALGLEARRAR